MSLFGEPIFTWTQVKNYRGHGISFCVGDGAVCWEENDKRTPASRIHPPGNVYGEFICCCGRSAGNEYCDVG